MLLIPSSANIGARFFNNRSTATVFAPFDNTRDVIEALNMSGLTLKIRAYRVRLPVCGGPVVELIGGMVTLAKRTAASVVMIGVGIPVDKRHSLYVVAHVMIILIASHNQILLRLFEAQVADRLGALPGDVDVGEVLSRLGVLGRGVVASRETRQRGVLLDVDPLD